MLHTKIITRFLINVIFIKLFTGKYYRKNDIATLEIDLTHYIKNKVVHKSNLNFRDMN